MTGKASRTILVVDDSEEDIILLRSALARAGAENRVIAARDGAEALELLRRDAAERPALVLLDVRMPLMNGIETLRAIRADPRLRRIPVVMLTSSRQPGDIRECYEQGADAYVVKPIEASEFDQAVAALHHFWLRVNEPPPS